MIVQYLSEYIAAINGDREKISAFEERYGYTPKPFLRDGIKDSRYYRLTNYHPDEESRYTAAVRLYSVVIHEPKVAPPRGKQREVIRQWLLWLSDRQAYSSVEELADLCNKETAVNSVETIDSIITQTSKLAEWRSAQSLDTKPRKDIDPKEIDAEKKLRAANPRDRTDFELLENFKKEERYLAANAKDKRVMKKAFAKMTYEERLLYFALD